MITLYYITGFFLADWSKRHSFTRDTLLLCLPKKSKLSCVTVWEEGYMAGNPGPEDSFQSTASKKSAPSVTELQMNSANNLNELENECPLVEPSRRTQPD